jgi:hypothetical protein
MIPSSATAQSSDTLQSPKIDVVGEYCLVCHGGTKPAAGLPLAVPTAQSVAGDAAKWELVVRKLRAGTMPPAGMPRPSKDELAGFIATIEKQLDAAQPKAARYPAKRLNRAEYQASVRDLLGVEMDVASMLPADDANLGFDNAASALLFSPTLAEAYLGASRKISRVAVGMPDIAPSVSIYRAKADLGQDRHLEGLPLGTRGGLITRHTFPLDAEYRFRTKLVVNTSAKVRGLDFPHDVVLLLDGKELHRATVGGPEDEQAASKNATESEVAITKRLEARLKVTAGPHEVGVAFADRSGALEDGLLEPFSRSSFDTQEQRGVPIIDSLQIGGPFAATGPGSTPSRAKIFTCTPKLQSEEVACAKKILSGLARKAYRRPVTEADLEVLLGQYQAGRNEAGATDVFSAGIANGVRFLLVSPDFLVRGSTSKQSDVALASRLSYFLWSSLPDDTLLAVAEQGRLRAPGELQKQVRRMLADPKARALTANFAGQWLYLRNLDGLNRDLETFPNFDDNLRQGFRKETELFFESIVAEDRSVLDLINADYTFVNERLAKHYGIPNVAGSRFRRVALASPERQGLLGQGSVLSVTSYATRTSPVLRGKWLLENLLGTPVPPPPPGVPALEENRLGAKPRSVRERLEEHRRNPACSVCHNLMDPLGFALENFDATGAWRTRTEAGQTVDSAGKLVDGTEVNGPAQLRTVLMSQGDTIASTITEKLMTYALGRGVAPADMPALRAIVRQAAKDNYRFSSLILGIVESAPFRGEVQNP